MKNLLILFLSIFTLSLNAQVPYYANSQGKDNLYTYFSTKFHPGVNNQQMYITAQYGLFNKLDLVTDATIGTGYAYQGFGTRFNLFNSNYFSAGGQLMIDFDINNSYKFNYNANSLYLNGNIYDGLHWVANTWWTVYKDAPNTVEQWIYLGYTIKNFTPMIGMNYHWTDLDKGVDLMAGVYYTYKNTNWYVWTSNLTDNLGDIRVVIGFDYKFKVK